MTVSPGEGLYTAAACAVCGHVLDFVTPQGWAHPAWLVPEDHLAVAVDPSEIAVRGKCDFCFADDPMWILPTRSFETTEGYSSAGDWAACDDCTAFIMSNDWVGLARRAVSSWSSRHGRMTRAQMQSLRRLYLQVSAEHYGCIRRA